MRLHRFQVMAAVCLAALAVAGCRHEAGVQTAEPGFRPDSEYASAFLEAADTATIAVYPSNVRRLEGTSYSAESQQQIVSLLNKNKMDAVAAQTGAIDPGPIAGKSQWEMFQNDMQAIAEVLKTRRTVAQYSLIMEFLFPPDSQEVFGIHCYVLDPHGANAFSFLLNAHHELFVDARLSPRDASAASHARLLEKATQVGVTALLQLVESADDPDLVLWGRTRQ